MRRHALLLELPDHRMAAVLILVYPEQALKDKVEGRVIVQFVIDIDGNVHSPTILRGLTTECDAEVLRVVGLMPRWIPAQQDGVAVESNFVLPIMFKINE